MVADGFLGRLRGVQVEYVQDWLATAVEETGSKQAEWRTDPARSGAGGALGDIGTHAFQLAAFVSGEAPSEVSAELASFVPGRRLDDDARALLRYASGARGVAEIGMVRRSDDGLVKIERVWDRDDGFSDAATDLADLLSSRLRR